MKFIIRLLVFLVTIILGYEVIHLIWLRDMDGWAVLSWVEEVNKNGPSSKAESEDVGAFSQVKSFDGERSLFLIDILTLSSLAMVVLSAWVLWARKKVTTRRRPWSRTFWMSLGTFIAVMAFTLFGSFPKHTEISDEKWAEIINDIRVGDVIGYRKEKWSARRELFAEGKATVIGYRLFKYGHLAIVVDDPNVPGRKALFTSQGQKGANLDEDLESLRTHNWDAWRLDKWDRVDKDRIREGVIRCQEKAGHFFGYDYSGMFSLWNENLKPEQINEFGDEYICSTVVVTLLYFAGFESDATPRQGLDLITPLQVVKAKGHFIELPDLPKVD
ncbi:hypothetical protein OAL09_02620 [Verrucomicrobia bacterium]|nr:hypothetical protein [Verrucomicrobiota bacterium]